MVSMIAGGLFNAVAFAGAGSLFSMLNRTGYKAETKRHNLATERFNREKERWYEKEVEEKTSYRRRDNSYPTQTQTSVLQTKHYQA